MSIIEQAARRLEQLERAGVAVPWSAARVGCEPDAIRPVGANDPASMARSAHNLAPRVAPLAAPLREVAAGARDTTEFGGPTPARAELTTRVTLDLERLRDAGYLVPDQVRSELAEQFRHLKRPLLKNARAHSDSSGHRGALIMITSAVPGEGKTFCSINLAMSMAMEVDTAVVLIDADVVRPTVFQRLGITAKPPGLLDLLTREALELRDALVATNVSKLSIMTSGERHRQSTEFLSSAAMDRLLVRLAAEYADHIVIFDAPPLLLTTESAALASKVGQVVVVVEAARTPRKSVEQAFAALRGCPLVMSVLNKSDESAEGRRYGYYYA